MRSLFEEGIHHGRAVKRLERYPKYSLRLNVRAISHSQENDPASIETTTTTLSERGLPERGLSRQLKH